jgi:hypothetical protein
MVHYVHERLPGRHVPAVIVKIWDQTTGLVNLQLFHDGPDDGYADGQSMRVTSRLYSENKEPATWHWIERA